MNPMTIPCPVCMAPAGVPCNAPTETGRRNVEWFHFKREESVASRVQSTEPAYTNVWGDDPRMYSAEFCPECGRLLPSHYNNCDPERSVLARRAQDVPLSAVPLATRTATKAPLAGWFRSGHSNGKWHRVATIHAGRDSAYVLRGACGTAIGVDSTGSVPRRDAPPAATETCVRCLRKERA
jgi:hypothetical protein